MSVQVLDVGVLSDTLAQQQDLQNLVQESGNQVKASILCTSISLEQLKEKKWPDVDLWVARLDLQTELGQQFVEELENLNVPVIYDEPQSLANLDRKERAKRFGSKINLVSGSGVSSLLEGTRAKEVWILAASTGGVEAVVEFFRHLPENIQDVAFLYVQHIDAKISDTLKKAITQNTDWKVFSCEKSHMLCGGCIYIVSPSNQFEISSTGVLNPLNDAWVGPFSPSIDQAMAKVARAFGKNAGAIIFSGMGDDGSKSCHFMKHNGGKIWVQAPESCTVDSMPVSAQATGCVSYSAVAAQLAAHFEQRNTVTHITGNTGL